MQNFRNYISEEVSFHPRMNIIYGNNAQGKTNLLEAVYFTLVSRSFRAGRESEIINWESPLFLIRGKLKTGEHHYRVDIGCHRSGCLQLKIDGSPVKRSNYLLRFPAIVFGPEDLLLVKQGPARRRRFLNLEGSRLCPLYYGLYRDYYRIVQQRNHLLRRGKNGSLISLEPWNKLLIKYGSNVIRERVALLAGLEKQCRRFFYYFTTGNEQIDLNYVYSFNHDGDLDCLETVFELALERVQPDEKRRGLTMLGPHLDDFSILINGREARRFASQGQQRAAALALKMAEVFLFEANTASLPVVLLDDVLSELDQTRQRRLLQFLWEKEAQVILTAAVPVHDLSLLPRDRSVLTVAEGRVTRG